ncbi:MAG TPA: DsbA family oxidoreductase [Vulgatibacter sp.]
MAVDRKPLRIDVISDCVCPWCYVGKRRLEEAMEATADRFEFTVNWRPFQLNPDMPAEGRDRRAYMREKFGEERVAQMHEHLREVGEEAGIPFDFEKIAKSPNTREAHRLIWMAQELGLQSQMAEAVFAAYFVQGKDIGDLDVLVEIAEGVGLDGARIRSLLESDVGKEEVRQQLEEPLRAGITAVPFFVVEGKFGVAGAQPAKAFVDAFERAAREQDA